MGVLLAYAIATVAVVATSGLGSYFTNSSVKSAWYDCIKPPITPPPIVFPIVWTVLYILLAIAFGRSLAEPNVNVMLIAIFVANLVLNVLWCYLYFKEKMIVTALMAILAIFMSIITIIALTEDPIVRYCVIPYAVWIAFATVLNAWSVSNIKKCRESFSA
jgi:translocator protein